MQHFKRWIQVRDVAKLAGVLKDVTNSVEMHQLLLLNFCIKELSVGMKGSLVKQFEKIFKGNGVRFVKYVTHRISIPAASV